VQPSDERLGAEWLALHRERVRGDEQHLGLAAAADVVRLVQPLALRVERGRRGGDACDVVRPVLNALELELLHDAAAEQRRQAARRRPEMIEPRRARP